MMHVHYFRNLTPFYDILNPFLPHLDVVLWKDLPKEVFDCYASIKDGFKKRFNLSLALLTDAALVHPGHKNLSWLPARDKQEAIEQFVDELMNVADADTANIGESSGENTVHTIALDSFFDFEVCSKTCIYSSSHQSGLFLFLHSSMTS